MSANEANLTSNDETSVTARFGALAGAGWAAVPLPLFRTRSVLGIGHAQLATIVAILSFYNSAMRWPSASQTILASRAGVTRQTVNVVLMDLRNRGLLATCPDSQRRRGGPSSAPLRYNLQPYFIAVLAVEARRNSNPPLALEVHRSLEAFVAEVRAGRWRWEIGRGEAKSVDETANIYRLLYLSEARTEIDAHISNKKEGRKRYVDR
jgi:hypothetical protein